MATVYEIITQRILDSLDKGVVPWKQPWVSSAPKNLISKKPYRGINVFVLGCQGYSSPWWLTFKQAKAKGGSVRKGEKSTPCVFYKRGVKEDKVTGEEKSFGVLRFYNLFHASQCEGIEVPPDEKALDFSPIAECEKLVAGYKDAPLVEYGGNRACYVPSRDVIQMPQNTAFHTPEEFYSTLFHEMVHSTGAKKRLDRKGITDPIMFGSHNYSFEELVAECGNAFLCGHAGIVNSTIENSIAYIQNWAKKLKSEPEWVVKAAAQAQKGVDLIVGEGAEEEDATEEAA